MYTISKDPEGVILLCHECTHVERVSGFDVRIGSQRTQAAQAMHAHERDTHGEGSALKSVPSKYGVMYQS
jgi:hypothetical protein